MDRIWPLQNAVVFGAKVPANMVIWPINALLIVEALPIALPCPPRSIARRKNALHGDAPIDRQVGLYVGVRQVAAEHRKRGVIERLRGRIRSVIEIRRGS